MCLAFVMHRPDVPICIDTRMIGKRGMGTTTYSHGLIAAVRASGRPVLLLKADHEDDSRPRKWFGALAGERVLRESEAGQGEPGTGYLTGRDIFRRAHVHFTLRRQFLELEPPRPFGIMHWTYPVPMRMAGWINIYTVHDLIPLVRPDLSSIRHRRHRAIMGELRRHADRIVTVSEAARSDIVSLLGVDRSKVVNCGQAVLASPHEPQPKPPAGLQAGSYFVFCGAIEPRKNLVRLIQAHALSGIKETLVIAGPPGWCAGEIVGLIDRSPNVMRTGYVGRDELLSLIAHARALVFPSLAEGFGLPVVEAMRLGTAVLTSSVGALAEVAGDAALLVDPTDVGALACGIRSLAEDDALVAALSCRGRIRAERFDLSHLNARVTTVYDDAIAAYGYRRPVAAIQ